MTHETNDDAAVRMPRVVPAGGDRGLACGNTDSARWRVRERAAMPEIWAPGKCELSREDLLAGIQAAGGIGCADALEATARLSGEIELDNGLHRWAVASELGISEVPVKMTRETEPEPFQWPLD